MQCTARKGRALSLLFFLHLTKITMYPYYIAFSIAGSNCFITATKTAEALTDLGPGLTAAPSRNPHYNPYTGIKLHHSKLLTKMGKPLRSAPLIMKVFNDLKAQGWDVKSEAFINKHWKK